MAKRNTLGVKLHAVFLLAFMLPFLAFTHNPKDFLYIMGREWLWAKIGSSL